MNTGNQSSKGRGKGSKGGGKGSHTSNKPGKGKSKGAQMRKKLREAEAKLAEAIEAPKSESEGFGFSCEQVDETGFWSTELLQWLILTVCVCIGIEF
jgi:hypothetical protein